MTEKNFDIYIEFGSSKIIASAFNKKDKKNFSISKKCSSYLRSGKINLNNSKTILEKLIFELEKKTQEYLNNINLMIDSPEALSVNLSLIKELYALERLIALG